MLPVRISTLNSPIDLLCHRQIAVLASCFDSHKVSVSQDTSGAAVSHISRNILLPRSQLPISHPSGFDWAPGLVKFAFLLTRGCVRLTEPLFNGIPLVSLPVVCSNQLIFLGLKMLRSRESRSDNLWPPMMLYFLFCLALGSAQMLGGAEEDEQNDESMINQLSNEIKSLQKVVKRDRVSQGGVADRACKCYRCNGGGLIPAQYCSGPSVGCSIDDPGGCYGETSTGIGGKCQCKAGTF